MAYGHINAPGVTGPELEAVRAIAEGAAEVADTALEKVTQLTSMINIVPSQSGTLTYTGSAQTPSWNNYDSSVLKIGGVTSATDAGTYTATFTPQGDYVWSDGTQNAVSVNWTIERATLSTPTQSGTLTYTGSAQTPSWSNYDSAKLTLSVTAQTNAGTYSASFTPTANYQWSDGSTSAKSVSWTIAKASGSLSLSATTMTLNNDTPSGTITVTRSGDGTITATSNNTGVATVSVSGTTVTVKGVASGSATITVKVAAGTNHTAPSNKTCAVTVTIAKVYGVSWDGSSSTSWTRTDDAASFTDPVPATSASSYGSSPFDDILPWSGMVKSERTGGTMVAIPKFWYKLTQSGTGIKIQIADSALDGYSVSPAHMDRGDGIGERDTVYIARYHCGATAYKSVTGQKPKVSITRTTARSSIHNLGTNIWQMDFAMRFTIWLLYLVEFANWNTQATIGGGCSQTTSSSSAVFANGTTDSMVYHTGNVQGSHSAYGACQYRWIEGLWDNCYDWMDGCYYSSSGMSIILNPSNFSDSANGTVIGTPSSGYPSAFTVKNVSGTFPTFIPTTASGSATTYSCDYWSFSASYPCLYVGGNYYQYANRGLFCVSYDGTSYAGDGIGCRLQELPS